MRDESTRVYLHTSYTIGSTGEGFQSLAKTAAGESFQICSWISQHWFCPRQQDPCREANTAIGVLVVVVMSHENVHSGVVTNQILPRAVN